MRDASSTSMSMASSFPEPTPTPPSARLMSAPFAQASKTFVESPAAHTIVSPSGEFATDQTHRASPVFAHTTRTPEGVTCAIKFPTTLPHQSVCSFFENPTNSTSPSCVSSSAPSSAPFSSTAKTRVSRMNVVTKNASQTASSRFLKFHNPFIPGSSTAALSLIPTPFLTTLKLPSFPTPEQVTNSLAPCRSRSTTAKSTMGPRLGK
mmetsp:Transcript_11424/g.42326  ORF Transcript_11424/g.42326 Transcript_11424/m.42326 type:complete len:207 (-) Transcript_11424:1296-1916(-)